MKEEKGSEVFPNRVRLRAATIRGGESFTIPEHNFATRVFGRVERFGCQATESFESLHVRSRQNSVKIL